MIPLRIVMALAAWAAVQGAEVAEEQSARVAALLADLDRPAQARQAFTELVALGEPVAPPALASLKAATVEGRRSRSLLVREVGGSDQIEAAIACLDDPDLDVRTHLLEFLAKPELRSERADARVQALEQLALAAPERALRAAAVKALGRIEDPASVEGLMRLLSSLAPAHRAQAARALGTHPLAREEVVEWVQESFDRPRSEVAAQDEVLAALLDPGYGLALAELAAGGTRPRDLMPFVLGARHPDAEVRLGAAVALDRFVARLRSLGEGPRAERALAALSGRGLDDDGLLAERARLALEDGEDPTPARAAARELEARCAGGDDFDSLVLRSQAGLLAAAAELAAGQPAEADPALDSSLRSLDSAIAHRLDLRTTELVAVQIELLERRALVELYRALSLLSAGADVARPEVLAHARSAHELSLRAQLVLTSHWGRTVRWNPSLLGAPPEWSLDRLIVHPLSPWALIFANDRRKGLPPARALELQGLLGCALASVAPLEMPGFARSGGVDPACGDPVQDPRRQALLREILAAYVRALQDAGDAMRELPRDPQDPGRGDELRTLLGRLAAQLAEEGVRDEGATWRAHLRLRRPSDAALPLAEQLRGEGRTSDARALTQRLLDDLRRAAEVLAPLESALLQARAEAALGANSMDEGDARRAEELLLKALERFDVLDQDLAPDGGGLARLRALRAEVLVSLAVNANVKLGDPARALSYIERAFALRENDFMRVLLACYRARAGRGAEARAVLRGVPVAPSNFYNLACTYALLGERELALDFLRRDFLEMRASPGRLERQKEWARGDPDLSSLRDDARFEDLVRAVQQRPGGGGPR